jgi:hypothetical protein
MAVTVTVSPSTRETCAAESLGRCQSCQNFNARTDAIAEEVSKELLAGPPHPRTWEICRFLGTDQRSKLKEPDAKVNSWALAGFSDRALRS